MEEVWPVFEKCDTVIYHISSKVLKTAIGIDLDHTLIRPHAGTFPVDYKDYVWLNKDFIINFTKHTDIVVFTNQGSLKDDFLKKITLLMKEIGEFSIFISTDKDNDYHKPHVGMYELFVELTGRQIEYFVGDACGRISTKNDKDHSSCDSYFAFNIGVPIKTPEEYYTGHYSSRAIQDPYDFIRSNAQTESIKLPEKPFVIFSVGFPASGKTTYFKNTGWQLTRVSQDELKTKQKTLLKVKQCVAKNESFIIDKIFGTVADRAEYLSLIPHEYVKICIFFNTPMFVCRHLNAYRSLVLKQARYISSIVYKSYNKNFQRPTHDEFDTIWELKLNIPIIGKYITSVHNDELEELKTGTHPKRCLTI